ncbi:putative ribosomal export protein Nmd3 [Helianthus annuus]|uniref:60S ribosomal export protein NMD3 n=1 Tax=Helianthus annuus TaxID=4232 RepID=A0A9K3EC49_HELAN|nr:putative ribosomal export protein Nmd3 [Helianthus annuus]KAJ0465396.1 putative ribosomal export protein Nmd3 [Helianthus annuus]KAJ0470215.1 putative ribosomal export protein Nmd3 [Helianthus annuus]KAJ0486997.1 putative ribosomal export protein Nmd3 [Helianthus annuus]KAJ0661116.1 putative ribosomal export protein Nmd3 [Helianthus annuus]
MAVVQLRQRVSYRRALFYLDKLIFKHDVVKAIRIKQMDSGIDYFFFANCAHVVKFAEFIQKVIPIYSSYDKQLVSRDRKRNKCNYKYTFSLEI